MEWNLYYLQHCMLHANKARLVGDFESLLLIVNKFCGIRMTSTTSSTLAIKLVIDSDVSQYRTGPNSVFIRDRQQILKIRYDK